MKEIFDAYVLWPLAQRVQNWIVDQATAHDFTVINKTMQEEITIIFSNYCKPILVKALQYKLFLIRVMHSFIN